MYRGFWTEIMPNPNPDFSNVLFSICLIFFYHPGLDFLSTSCMSRSPRGLVCKIRFFLVLKLINNIFLKKYGKSTSAIWGKEVKILVDLVVHKKNHHPTPNIKGDIAILAICIFMYYMKIQTPDTLKYTPLTSLLCHIK